MTDTSPPPGLPPFDLYRGDGERRPDAGRALAESSPLHEEHGAYLADPELQEAVNIALAVGQPLLLTGEPGCGKTRLAWSVAHELDLGDPLCFFTRSTSRAQDLLYSFDAVLRFHDIQSGLERAGNPAHYVHYGPLGQAIVGQRRRVVLIDEIDKAPRDFPNDLLHEIDRMEFEIRELEGDERFKASAHRPVVVITSNSERLLPVPFLRRCVFFDVSFPRQDKLIEIVEQRLGPLDLDGDLVRAAVDQFQQVRQIKGLNKRPATGELLSWLIALATRGVEATDLKSTPLPQLPLWPALLKDRDDHRRLQEASLA